MENKPTQNNNWKPFLSDNKHICKNCCSSKLQKNILILRYFSVQPGGGVQAGEVKKPAQAPLELVWQDNGTVAMKAESGKFVGAKKSGHLFANIDVLEDNSRFFFYLTNRPIMILKCEQGYVGYRMATSVKLDCNKAGYATFQVERAEGGLVHFKGKFQCEQTSNSFHKPAQVRMGSTGRWLMVGLPATARHLHKASTLS